jgi:hypothetical protein
MLLLLILMTTLSISDISNTFSYKDRYPLEGMMTIDKLTSTTRNGKTILTFNAKSDKFVLSIMKRCKKVLNKSIANVLKKEKRKTIMVNALTPTLQFTKVKACTNQNDENSEDIIDNINNNVDELECNEFERLTSFDKYDCIKINMCYDYDQSAHKIACIDTKSMYSIDDIINLNKLDTLKIKASVKCSYYAKVSEKFKNYVNIYVKFHLDMLYVKPSRMYLTVTEHVTTKKHIQTDRIYKPNGYSKVSKIAENISNAMGKKVLADVNIKTSFRAKMTNFCGK